MEIGWGMACANSTVDVHHIRLGVFELRKSRQRDLSAAHIYQRFVCGDKVLADIVERKDP